MSSTLSTGVSGVSSDMVQGNIVNTGNPLDLAMEGDGYFVLSDGSQDIYTRMGALGVDMNSNLIDRVTGYLVQRIGSTGEVEGFQAVGDSNIKVPYDVLMAAKATGYVTVAGNLSRDATFETPRTNVLKSNITYTTSNGIIATGSSYIGDLDQFSGTAPAGAITISGINHDGRALTVGSSLRVGVDTNLDDLVDYVNTILEANKNDDGSVDVASLIDGRIVITDGSRGYSRTDIKLTYTAAGSENLTMPGYFEITTVGGAEVKDIGITVYDSKGGLHLLSGAFVRTDAGNTWDLVMTAITGDVSVIDIRGRISGIEFDPSDGSYRGLNSATGDSAEFIVTFAHDEARLQVISIDMGTEGQFNGLTQFSGSSTAVAREQDGYEAGSLSAISVNKEGVLIGAFSNGIKKNIARVQVALFQNTSGLESIGNGYFVASAESGEAIAGQALEGGAGSIHGGALEKSNADVATEFVNMIQAQNGFQANARTITVANNILRELTNLIR